MQTLTVSQSKVAAKDVFKIHFILSKHFHAYKQSEFPNGLSFSEKKLPYEPALINLDLNSRSRLPYREFGLHAVSGDNFS